MSPELTAAVALELASHCGGQRNAAAALSAHYRAGGRSDSSIDLAAYLTVRLPATYAAAARVLAEVRLARPGFAPASLLDAGCGPGTASWAAAAAWPQLAGITMLDANARFLALAGRLAINGAPAMAAARLVRGDILSLGNDNRASLVVASYALAEISTGMLDVAADRLWQAAEDILVLVEPGTPAGFGRLRRVRDRLLRAGAVPVAPCPHALACPMTGADWCHFSVRLARSRAHMHAKQAQVPFEDEPFAYLALARQGTPTGAARILAPPRTAKPGITFKLCTEKGLEQRHVARRDAPLYKKARKRQWGDV